MFVALPLSEAAVEHLQEFLAPRQEAGADLRWTVTEQWHLTLAFLPDVADRHLDELEERLTRAARRRTAVEVALAGGGAFPGPSRGRVLFAAVDAGERTGSRAEELRRMATGARAAAVKSGIEVEGARFHPHVTLARARRPTEMTRWIRVLEGYRGPTWCTERLVLVESHLGEGPRRRPRYEIRADFPLGAGAETRA
ncbi:RNA 2',3'-cyclic phosphodiesterase [Nocardioides mesophilus]|nr:RNA 2',3'-cyclic phosphodiesterase [Nocardioides mesophilus]